MVEMLTCHWTEWKNLYQPEPENHGDLGEDQGAILVKYDSEDQ